MSVNKHQFVKWLVLCKLLDIIVYASEEINSKSFTSWYKLRNKDMVVYFCVCMFFVTKTREHFLISPCLSSVMTCWPWVDKWRKLGVWLTYECDDSFAKPLATDVKVVGILEDLEIQRFSVGGGSVIIMHPSCTKIIKI